MALLYTAGGLFDDNPDPFDGWPGWLIAVVAFAVPVAMVVMA